MLYAQPIDYNAKWKQQKLQNKTYITFIQTHRVMNLAIY